MWNYRGSRYLLVGTAVQTSRHQSHRYTNLPTGRVYLFRMDSKKIGPNRSTDTTQIMSQPSQFDDTSHSASQVSSSALPMCQLISICRMDWIVFALKPLDDEHILVGSGRKLCLMSLDEHFHFHLLAETITRFPVLSIDTRGYHIAIADQKDGILLYIYRPEDNQILPLRVGGTVRLSSDNLLLNERLCVATDKAGSLFGVACDVWSNEEEEPIESTPEVLDFHLGEVALRLHRGSLVFSASHITGSPMESDQPDSLSFIAMTLLGSVFSFRGMTEKDYSIAHLLQHTMSEDNSLKYQLVGFPLNEYRYQYFSPEAVIDGDFLSQFLTLPMAIQERIVERMNLYLSDRPPNEQISSKESLNVETISYLIVTLNQYCI